MTTDLTILAKTELNAMLTAPLNASALKKIGKPDLIRMILAQEAAKAPTADYMQRDESNHWGVDPDKTEPTPAAPTLQAVLDGLTAFEKAVLVAHLDAGIDCNGAATHDAMQADNMTWSDVAETSKRTGLTKKQVNGVLTSLSGKGLVVTDCDPVNGEGPVQQVLSDWGISTAFELLADGIEAKVAPAAKPTKPAPAPKAAPAPKPRAPRVVEDRIIVAPANDLKMVRPTGEGSKRHLLAQALLKGATIEDLMEVTGWNKSTATSALRWDVPQMGLGVECKGEKYFLILPQGVKAIPVRAKDMIFTSAHLDRCRSKVRRYSFAVSSCMRLLPEKRGPD